MKINAVMLHRFGWYNFTNVSSAFAASVIMAMNE
jgi:hypothetical protein